MHSFPLRTYFLTGVLLSISVASSSAHSAAEEMAQAAQQFLAALDADQQGKARFDFKTDERENWHFVPKDRAGLPLKDLAPWQRPLAHALLGTGLSQRGLLKAETIMSLEETLRALESKTPRMTRDPDLYYVSVFGKPAVENTWGWRFEGHHLSVNFTLVGGKEIVATPSFLGSNPAEIREGPRKGLRVLAGEEDGGRNLFQALDAEQRKAALIETTAPKEILTSNVKIAKPLEESGISAQKLSAAQKKLLTGLIQEYLGRTRMEVATNDWQKIEKAGVDRIRFAWAGGAERGEGHYYRVQGPTFLLEYDNTQNDNNHVHAVWRDFNNDFGRDLLREHYARTPHDK